MWQQLDIIKKGFIVYVLGKNKVDGRFIHTLSLVVISSMPEDNTPKNVFLCLLLKISPLFSFASKKCIFLGGM